jgi:hypothetical protein
LRRLKFIDNISGLQLFQLMKPVVFLIISIIFTKSSLTHLTRVEIGQWEMFMFIAGIMTFFWVTGIIQSLLPLYHRNKTGQPNHLKFLMRSSCYAFSACFFLPSDTRLKTIFQFSISRVMSHILTCYYCTYF